VGLRSNGFHDYIHEHIKGYTTKEVAEKAEVSIDTIHRWRKAGLVEPARGMQGKVIYYIFSEKDLEVIRDLKKTIRPGARAIDDTSPRVSHPPATVKSAVMINKAAVRRKLLKRKAAAAKSTP
jgi:DNA-binding transcriptional MerR regulator